MPHVEPVLRLFKRISRPSATTHLSGGLRGTIGRTGRREDAAGPLVMAADVALVVPVLASHPIHRSARTPGVASGSMEV